MNKELLGNLYIEKRYSLRSRRILQEELSAVSIWPSPGWHMDLRLATSRNIGGIREFKKLEMELEWWHLPCQH